MNHDARKPNVLFVDDELDVLLGLQMSLRRSPINAFITTQPNEVPFFLTAQPIDVVVCDECMPTVSGSALLDSVRVRFPSTARILLTGHCDLPKAIRAIKRARLFRYLTKPTTAPTLVSAILNAVSEQSLATLPKHVRRARMRSRLLKDLETAYPGIAQEMRIDADRSVIPAEALLDSIDDPLELE